MKNTQIIIISIVVVIMFLVLMLFYGKQKPVDTFYNWNPTMTLKQKQPYDLDVFRKSLKIKYPNYLEAESNTFKQLNKFDEETDYYAIGNNLYFTAAEASQLLEFVYKGNNVFIAANSISDTALLKLGIPKSDLTKYSVSKKEVNFILNTNSQTDQQKSVNISYFTSLKEKGEYSWQFIKNDNETNLYDEPIEEVTYADDVLEEVDSYEEAEYDDEYDDDNEQEYYSEQLYYGNDYLSKKGKLKMVENLLFLDNKQQAVYRAYSIGKGRVFILTTPLVLSNLYIAADSTRQLPIHVLSYLGANNCILDIEASYFKSDGMPLKKQNSPLRYFLSKKWFKRGFYGLLLVGLCFIALRSFRKLRPTEIYEISANRSVEQIKDLAAVLYHDKDMLTIGKYLKIAYEHWYAEHKPRLIHADENTKHWETKCNVYLNQATLHEEQIRDFQIKFYQLKNTYGK